VPEESCDGTWIRQTSSLEKYVVKGSLALHEFLDCSNASILDAATQTAVRKLKKLFGFFSLGGDVDGLGFNVCCVAKLIHDNCNTETMLFREDTLEKSRLSCTQKTADNRERDFARLVILLWICGLLLVLYENWNLVVVHM